MKVFIVVDMQNDFIDGALGTKEAEAVVNRIADRLREYEGRILFTRDTHGEDYAQTQEGRNLPVAHCIRGSKGWEISPRLAGWVTEEPINKPGFGSIALGEKLVSWNAQEAIEEIVLAGVCTDICVISNAMILKAFLPEVPIVVDASCCAGINVESHKRALEAMKMCQIQVVNEQEAQE